MAAAPPSILPPRKIRLHLVNGGALRRNDPIHHVADGNQPDHLALVNDRQMADALFGHQPHGVFDGMVGGDGDDGRGNDLTHERGPGGFARKGDFAGVIALGKDANQPLAVHDRERPDVFFGEKRNGFKDGGFAGNGP